MTVDELIDRLTEMPGYREVGVNSWQPVVDLTDRGTYVELVVGG
jgi:hypothetical protein